MHIALTAHDAKKELMVQFCIAYCGILSRHSLCGTGTTGKMISEATGLKLQRFLSGPQGGDQQIAARISCNEIDLLLFFRDPLNPQSNDPSALNRHSRGAHPRPGTGRSGLAGLGQPLIAPRRFIRKKTGRSGRRLCRRPRYTRQGEPSKRL